MADELLEFDEGLGTTYERIMLNDFFDRMIDRYGIGNVLEAPFYGMTGIAGINSFHFARRGCKVTIADNKKRAVAQANRAWSLLPFRDHCRVELREDLTTLPYPDGGFDFSWNFAAMQYLGEQAHPFLRELVRVTRRALCLFFPNRLNYGYWLRKAFLQRNFFKQVDESWVDPAYVHRQLEEVGARPIERGVMDVPFWPDTNIPVSAMAARAGLRPKSSPVAGRWHWNVLRSYMGNDLGLEPKIRRLSFLEKADLPLWAKLPWAHHRYILCERR